MNVYEIVNNRILELLEHGTVPWHRPWNATSGMPKNLVTKKEYRGVNVFLLSCMRYSSPYWLSFKQVSERNGHVRKGEKATVVVFWKWLDRKDADDPETSGNGRIPLLRYYNVFNLEQCEGIEAPEPEETVNQFDPIDKAADIITKMPMKPEVKFGGNRAYYSPSFDTVTLPHLLTFEGPEEYYNTMFHELVHSTGHAKRLGRKSILEPSFYGSHEYSKEELVAEMGAAFLCGHSGIENMTLENSAAYVKGWLSVLKGDKTLLVHAATAAQKAADYILNISHHEDQPNP